MKVQRINFLCHLPWGPRHVSSPWGYVLCSRIQRGLERLLCLKFGVVQNSTAVKNSLKYIQLYLSICFLSIMVKAYNVYNIVFQLEQVVLFSWKQPKTLNNLHKHGWLHTGKLSYKMAWFYRCASVKKHILIMIVK